MTTDPHVYKHGYAFLFSRPDYVRELLESFVDKEFADSLDFSSFQALSEKHYLDKDLQDYADDLVINIKCNGKDAYVYLLLEFQSSPDKFMAVRMLNYLSLLYLDIIKEAKNQKRQLDYLPPVFPILLYNGDKPWNATDSIQNLIENHDFLKQFYPHFRYLKIIENEYSIADLQKIKNCVSALFIIENTKKQNIEQHITQLSQIIGNENAHTVAALAVYLKHLLKNERINKNTYEEIDAIASAKGAKSMLVNTIAEWREEIINQAYTQAYTEGELKGKLKGKLEGELKEKYEFAKRLIRKNFPINEIAELTGLPELDISQLKAQQS